MNVIDYQFRIRFNADAVTVTFSGESVSLEQDAPEKAIRPRHLRLVTELHQIMREYAKNNQSSQQEKA